MKNFFQQFYLSCVDFSFYKTIVRQKISISVRYFIKLLLLTTLISSAVYCYYFKITLDLFYDWAQTHLPEIMIQNGKITSPVEQPYIVSAENFVFILDTTGKTDRVGSKYANGLLLKTDSIYFKRNGMEEQHVYISWVKQFAITLPILTAWKQKIVPLFVPVVFLLTLIGVLISKFFQAFLFSYGASIFFPFDRTGLRFGELLNLALYSATPPIAIAVLAQVLNIQIPLFWWIYFGMYAAFFIGAFSQCRVIKDKDKNEDIDLDL